MASLITQGDSYALPLQILNRATNAYIGANDVERAEFTVGNLTKYYPDDVPLSGTTFLFPLSQEETFAFDNYVKVNVRVKFFDGNVYNVDFGSCKIKSIESRVIL